MGVTVREKPKGSGVWWVYINEKGERKAKRVGSKTAATKVQKELEVELARNAFHLGKKDMPTLAQYAEDWLENVVRVSRKHNTYRAYKIIANRHILPALGTKRLDEITPKDVSDLVYERKKAGFRSGTVKSIRGCLKLILKRAVRPDELIRDNPARDIEIPRPPDELPSRVADPMDWEERDILEATFKEHYPMHYPLVVCGFRTGLRIGELTGLKWQDIDFVGKTITVTRNVTNSRVTTPKSKTSRREVRMTDGLVQVLERHRRAVMERTLRKGWGQVPEWVFPAEEGGYIQYTKFLTRVWNKAMDKSKLRRRTPHDMRHTYATLRLSGGDALAEVAKELGHSTAEITFRTYYKWMPKVSTTDINKLDGKTRGINTQPPRNQEDLNT